MCGVVGTTPKVTRTSGDCSATAKPSSSAAWNASTGFMIWSAVTTATILVKGGLPWSPLLNWLHRLGAAASIVVIVYLGYCATGDLVDLDWPLAVQLPWMGERVWWLELLGGLSGAIVVPLALSLLWGRFLRAGVIGCVTLAVLLHVTLGLVAISLTYLAMERLAKKAPTAARLLLLLVMVAVLAGFVGISFG